MTLAEFWSITFFTFPMVDHVLFLPNDRFICQVSLLRDGKIGFLIALIMFILLLTGDCYQMRHLAI